MQLRKRSEAVSSAPYLPFVRLDVLQVEPHIVVADPVSRLLGLAPCRRIYVVVLGNKTGFVQFGEVARQASAAFHAKLAAAAFLGLNGAKIWLVNSHKGRYPVSRHYTEVLERHRGFYPAVSASVNGSVPAGVLVPCTGDYPAFNAACGNGNNDTFAPDGWGQLIFSWYGIPFAVTQDFGRDGIYALGGRNALDNLGDGDIRRILSHRVIVDGLACWTRKASSSRISTSPMPNA